MESGGTKVTGNRNAERVLFEERVAAVIEEAGLDDELAIEPLLRNRPTTERGHETIDRLLDASLDVIARDGIRAVNTRAVAREAGVNIATLYQYFEDIESLLLAAARRDQVLRNLTLSRLLFDLTGEISLREWIDSVVELMIARTVESERRRAVLKISQTLPAARGSVTEAWETGAKLLAIGLSYRYGKDPDRYWLPITRTIHSTVRLTMDDAMATEPLDRDRVDRVVEMCWQYLVASIPGGL